MSGDGDLVGPPSMVVNEAELVFRRATRRVRVEALRGWVDTAERVDAPRFFAEARARLRARLDAAAGELVDVDEEDLAMVQDLARRA